MSTNALAINGGSPLRTEPWPTRGLIGREEKAAVTALFDQAIESGNAPGYGGPREEAYCREFAEVMGGGYADGVSSGTAAVYVALRALDLEPFSEVVVACVTDPGGMMPIPLINCIPVPADTAPGSFNAGPEQIEEAITPHTSAILIAHIFGEPADVEGILAVARRHNLPVVEDCAQAHGAKLNGQPVGTFGDVAAFSTMFGKHYCTGGQGGVVFTRDENLAPMVRRAADRGKPFGLPAGSTNCFASLNLNLDEFGATIGREQLRKMPALVDRIRTVAAHIRDGLEDVPGLSVPNPIPGAVPSYWKLRIEFQQEAMTCDKSSFCDALKAEGLTPIMENYFAGMPHLQDWFVNHRVFGTSGYPWASPAYKGDPNRQFPCPNAMDSMHRFFALLCNEAWTTEDADDALTVLHKVEAAYRR
ncbi:MAG: DegT/DnrJ/EryC1/StrS family aminotransferase [Candidatus Pacebacteria bacterium]|nr:DegT/DnrJ/EryC1/StrS family aminotransferase [Candidatus Paceibacterota bacterium]